MADLKVRINLRAEDKEDDALLEVLEREAVATFERLTNLYVGPVISHVEYFAGGRAGVPFVRLRAPLVTLTSVETLGGVFVGAGDWISPWALSAFDFVAAERSLYLIDGSAFPRGRRNIRVTYQGGYAPRQEPEDIRGAIASMVAATYRAGRRTVTPVSLGAEAPAGAGGLVVPSDAGSVINSWRINPGL